MKWDNMNEEELNSKLLWHFVAMTFRMLKEQKKYFKDRTRENLLSAKDMEKRVAETIEEMRERATQKGYEHPGMHWITLNEKPDENQLTL